MADSIKSSGTARLPSSSELDKLRALSKTDAAVKEDRDRRMLLVLASGMTELALGIKPCCCKLDSDGACNAANEDPERDMLLVCDSCALTPPSTPPLCCCCILAEGVKAAGLAENDALRRDVPCAVAVWLKLLVSNLL